MIMTSTASNGNDCGSSGNGSSSNNASGADLHDHINHIGAKGGGGGDNDGHLKKGPWTAEEDAILMEYVRKHGEGNWNAVQRHSGLARCGKSCRLRWANHLRPNLKKGAFSPEEERLIVELHAKFGNKWARMASLLPGRTDNEIKNYWNTRVKRHQRQGLPLYPPNIQPQNPPSPHFHHHHHHHNKSPSISIPTTPPSSFTFQTHHFSSPTNPTHHHHTPLSPTTTTSTSHSTLPLFDFSQTHHLHHHNRNPYSSPTTPTSSFSFQTAHQLQSPTTPPHPQAQTVVVSSTLPPLSPLPSPSTTPTATTNTNSSALPLFDFNLQRTPPILQTPMRFKRFSSSPAIVTAASNNFSNMNTNCQYSMPLPPLLHPSAPNTSPTVGHQIPTCFVGLTSGANGGSSIDFHNDTQKENQEMCTLLAAVTQQELPSDQVVLPTNHNRNMGMGVAAAGSKFSRKVAKNKIVKDNGKLEFSLEDLLQEAKITTECGQISTDQNNMALQQQKPKLFISEGFDTNWDQPNSLDLSSGLDTELEIADQLSEMTEDLTKVLNNLPCSMQPELYSDSADISKGQPSAVTDDNIGFEMQHLASLFTPSDHDRTLGSCPWDNLPGIC